MRRSSTRLSAFIACCALLTVGLPSAAVAAAPTTGLTRQAADPIATQPGTISGRVTNANSEGVADVVVSASGAGYGTAVTSTDGSYDIVGLTPGDYRVRFSTYSGESAKYVDQWFPAVADEADAVAVTVVGQQVTPQINAELIVGGSISGVLTAVDADGGAHAGSAACASAESPSGVKTASADAQGNYLVQGLAAGSYTVRFYDCMGGDLLEQWYSNATRREDATDIAVTLGERATNINAALQTGGAISGIVHDSEGAPVNAACITVTNEGQAGLMPGVARSDVDGGWSVHGLRTGTYIVEVDPCGQPFLLRTYYPGTQNRDDATAVQVVAGQATPPLDVVLPSSGQIVGTVRDTDGKSLSGIDVRAVDAAARLGELHWANTDPDGRYVIDGLPAGDYKVEFSGQNFSQQVNVVTQWFDNKPDEASANTVSVALKKTTTVDAAMAQGATITGQVKGADGSPLADACVDVMRSDQPGGGSLATGISGDDGRYTVSGVPGVPVIIAARGCSEDAQWMEKYYPDSLSPDGAHASTLEPGSTLTGIDFELDDGGYVTGMVTDSSGRPLGGACVNVSTATSTVSSTNSDAQGRYRAALLDTGDYIVHAQGCGAGDYKERWYDGKSTAAQADPVHVTLGGGTSDIDFHLLATGETAPAVPGAPTLNSVTPANHQAVVTWRPPSDDGGSAVTGYEVSLTPGDIIAYPSTATSSTLTGLDNGTSYEVKVRAVNSQGAGAWSVTQDVVPQRDESTVTLSVSPAVVIAGQDVTLAASVASVVSGATEASGSVTFQIGGDPIGTVDLAGGKATLTWRTTSLGLFPVTAVYSGGDDLAPATSAPSSFRVVTAATTTSLSSSNNPSVAGQPTTLTAHVLGSDEGTTVSDGQVRFSVGLETLGVVAVDSNGTATLTKPFPTGLSQVVATFEGTPEFAASSAQVTQTVAQASTTTALTSAPNPSGVNDPVTLTVRVSPVSPSLGIVPAAVLFFDGVTQIGEVEVDDNGDGTLTVALDQPGEHQLTARFIGNSDYGPSTSAPVRQNVKLQTVTSVAAAPEPTVWGQRVTLDATVAPASGDGTPTGTVAFFVDGQGAGTSALSASGTGSLDVTGLAVGQHQVIAVYNGDSTYLTSSAPAGQHQVTKASTTVQATVSPSPLSPATSATVGVRVDVTGPGTGTPTGSVRVFDGATELGTAALTDGAVRVPIGKLSEGIHALTVEFSGDAHTLSSSRSVETTVSSSTKTLTVTVVDAANQPIEGATAVVQTADGLRAEGTTGTDGTAILSGLPDGDYAVKVIAPGYQGNVGHAVISGGAGESSVTLTRGGVVDASATVSPMTLEEIEAAGIDTSDPDNRNSSFFSIFIPGVGTICGYGGDGGLIDWQQPRVGCDYTLSHGRTSTGPGGTTYGVTYGMDGSGNRRISLLSMPGASWLKEFFDVSLTVINPNAAGITLTNNSARLLVDDGVGLAGTAIPQSLTAALPDIPGGSSRTTTWILEGDVEGDHEAQVDYTGTVDPFHITATMSVKSPGFHVFGASALKVTAEMDDHIYPNLPFHLRAGLTNTTDVPVYNANLNIGPTGDRKFIFQPRQHMSWSTRAIQPGETFWSDDIILVSDTDTPVDVAQVVQGQVAGAKTVTAVSNTHPAPYTPSSVPKLSGEANGTKATLTWEPVTGAAGYQIFRTGPDSNFIGASPEASVDARSTTLSLAAGSNADYVYAVSAIVDGRNVMVHPLIYVHNQSPTPDGDGDEPCTALDTNCDGIVRVAILGDSFISGEGAADGISSETEAPAEPKSGYEYCTDTASISNCSVDFARWRHTNMCHRSRASWAWRAAQELATSDSDILFAACSGALTGDVIDHGQYPDSVSGVYGAETQTATLREFGNVDVVLLSIGGNDAGFKDVITMCGVTDCVGTPNRLKDCLLYGCSMTFLARQMEKYRSEAVRTAESTEGRIALTVDLVRSAAPSAQVFLAEYPDPVDVPSTCILHGLVPDAFKSGISPAEQKWLTDTFLGALNNSVDTAAATAGAHLLPFAQAFKDHGICAQVPYANGARGGGDQAFVFGNESFHPNAYGHRHMAGIALPLIKATTDVLPRMPSIPVVQAHPQPSLEVTSSSANGQLGAAPGSSLVLQGSGVSPQSAGALALNSLPTVVGQWRADDQGNWTSTIQLPANVAPGPHEIFAIDTTTGVVIERTYVLVDTSSTCPSTAGASDADGDLLPDGCDSAPFDGPSADADGDGTINLADNCPTLANPDQADIDDNGIGDMCDPNEGANLLDALRSSTNQAPDAPQLTVEPRPDTSHAVTVGIAASDPDDRTSTLTSRCSLDGAAATVCDTSVTYSGLAVGDHTLTVTTGDPAGFVSPVSTVRWRVVGTEPTPGSGPGGPVDPGAPSVPTTRLSGADRYDTAVSISRAVFDPGVAAVYVVAGGVFPDALAGGPVAAHSDAPLLLTPTDRVPDLVLDEIRRLRPGKIVVFGGPSAVGDAAVAQLDRLAPTRRVAGPDRYATASEAARAWAHVDTVYLATGTEYADALSGGGLAAATDAPVLLTKPGRLPPSVMAALSRLNPKHVVVLGGVAAINPDIEGAVKAAIPGITITRLDGVDRYATAAKVLAAWPAHSGGAMLASGAGFPDALAGIPAAAHLHAALVLSRRTCLPATVKEAMNNEVRHYYLLGGDAAISGGAATAVCR